MATLSSFESKPVLFTVLDFLSTCVRLIFQAWWFWYIIDNTRYPLYILQDLIYSIISFFVKSASFYRGMKLTYKLKNLPDVTAEDLSESDKICLICYTEIETGKRLNCGHSFHYGCISTWVQKNDKKECPKCKKVINLDEKEDFKKKSKKKKSPEGCG